MNFHESLDDYTQSHLNQNNSVYYESADYKSYFSDDAITACGGDILKNVNNKKIDRNADQCTKNNTSGPIQYYDTKLISDTGRDYTGMDESFRTKNKFNKLYGGGSNKSIMNDGILLLLVFAFVMYIIYSIIALKMEVNYLTQLVNIIALNNKILTQQPPISMI